MNLDAPATKRFLKRFVLWPAVALAVFAAAGFLALPPIVKSVLIRQLSSRLHRPVEIRTVRINPFALSVRVEGFSMADRDGSGPFLSFEELYLNLQAASVVRRGPVLREILLRSPSVTVVRNDDATYNFSDILEESAREPSEGGSPLRYSLNNIRVVGGSVDFDDRPKHTRHAVRGLAIAIPFLSNLPYAVDVFVRPSFEANVNGTDVALQGRTKPYSASRETTVDLIVRNFEIPHYLEYVPVRRNFRVPSGMLDAETVLSFSQPAEGAPTVALSGNVTLKDLAVTDTRDAPALRLPSLAVAIGSLEPLARRVRLDNVVVTAPELTVVRETTGVLNVVSLLPGAGGGEGAKGTREAKAGEEAGEQAPATSWSVEVDGFRLHGGKVSFSDLAAPTPFQAAAGLALSTRFRSAPGGAGDEAALSGLEADVTTLRLRRRGERKDFIDVPSIGVRGVDVDFARRTATIGEVTTRKGTLTVTRKKDGTLDLADLVSPPPATAGKAAPRRPGAERAPEWLIRLQKAALLQYAVEVVDRTPRDPVTVRVSPLDITAEDLSTEENSRGTASVRCILNRTGKVAVGGAVGLNPVSANLAVDVRRIDLVPLQPYVADRLDVSLTGGSASAKGRLTVAARAGAIRTTSAGNLLVTKLAAVDKATSEDFLKWDSLHLDGIRVTTNPASVAIREVALTDFASRVVITPEGTLNLQAIVRKEPEAEDASAGGAAAGAPAPSPPESPGPPTPVEVGTVTLQGGRIHFTDRFIKPNYSANLLEVGGRVSGLSSEETRMADVDLRGKLENYAPLEITGKINPLRDDLFVDLKIDFKDMDLSPLTPYSGRYAGYTIEKGKLSLSLKYLIAERKLDASNNVFLDQFTFGGSVESPDATKLPVRLAVALLKDRNGEIRLDLPVSGSLDDPEFRVWPVIVRILVNLLAKAAASPFALLGAIFGGGEELSYLEFDYGKAALDGPGEAKLGTLIRALHDRPALKLEIAGHVDGEKDREALGRILFDRKVRSQKLKDLLKRGAEAPALDNVVVDAREYPEYLKRAYREEKFPKPRNFLGMLKDLPVPEMEKLMRAHLQVTDDDLRLLAQQRAQAVKDFLLASEQVEPERVFLLEPKALAPENDGKRRKSRVEFFLR